MPNTTTDSELHIATKGRTVRPVSDQNGRYIFVLPKNAAGVRLFSRAGSPTDGLPWLDDRRSLGVYMERIAQPEGLSRRGNAIFAQVATALPVNADEANLAARHVAANA